VNTDDPARRHGISEATIYNWKAKYGGHAMAVAVAENDFLALESSSLRAASGEGRATELGADLANRLAMPASTPIINNKW
jgi:hypothetical protein